MTFQEFKKKNKNSENNPIKKDKKLVIDFIEDQQ